MKAAQLKIITGLISQAIERKGKFIENCKGDINPQVLEMKHRTQGEVTALQDVYDALTRNDLVCLRIEAQGTI